MIDDRTGDVVVVVAPRGRTDAADRAVLSATAAWVLGLDPATVRVERRCPDCGSAAHGVPYLAGAAPSGAAPSVAAAPTASSAPGAGPAGAAARTASSAPGAGEPAQLPVPVHLPVHLSLTRSGGYVAVAVSLAGPVGIDIERVEAVARAPLEDVALSPLERARASGAAGRSLVGAADLAGIWCAKEAILKATGDGLRVDPRDLTLARPTAPGFRPALDAWPGAGFPLEDIALASFDPASFDPAVGLGFVGRVAVLTSTGDGTAHPRVTLRLVGITPANSEE